MIGCLSTHFSCIFCMFAHLHLTITGNRPLDFSQTKAQNLICGGQDCSPDSLQAQIKVTTFNYTQLRFCKYKSISNLRIMITSTLNVKGME